MSKPYIAELMQLTATYDWACCFDVAPLRRAVLTAGSLPLVAVGSGGSLTAAHFLASVHRRYTGQVTSVLTPLDGVFDHLDRRVSAWLLSAGGGNVDILAAFATLVMREPTQLTVICGQPESPLARKAKQHPYVDLVDFSMPAGKDGFLATNSLLAFCVMFARAYSEAYDLNSPESDRFDRSVGEVLSGPSTGLAWRDAVASLWTRDTTVVLHGVGTKPGAVDLESKFTEAALGNLQIADYRNFAHGRHYWLAKRGETTGILAFTTPEDRALADRTLALIPAGIPTARIDLEGNYLTTSLTSLVVAFYAAGWAGAARGIDPGRPRVPEFGRRLYSLTLPKNAAADHPILSRDEATAIERKTSVSVDRLLKRGDLAHWRTALTVFKRALTAATFSGVVFDYDGTLVDARARFDPPKGDILRELVRLLEAGLIIGIVTGRGVSVRHDLRACLPADMWRQVIVGYYNGADVAPLGDDSGPDGTCEARAELASLARALRSQPELAQIATQTDRPKQITLEPRQAVPQDRLWDIVNQVIQLHGVSGVCAVRSSHSVDILAPNVSKTRILDRVVEAWGGEEGTCILKIGDRGRWPGNDYALLREPYSLSVDELSVDPTTCWNLAPRGQRGVQATLEYCRALEVVAHGAVRFAFLRGVK